MSAVSETILREIEAFLYREAELLDERQYNEWLALLSEDVQYELPQRVTRERSQGEGILDGTGHFLENQWTLRKRIERLATEYAWAEDPPSRTRHFVTNIRVAPGEQQDEYLVRSNVLVYRTRGDDPTYDVLSAERSDVLRRVDGSLRLARRRVLLDHSIVLTRNLAIFL
uniref:Hypothetical biphenyl dioxygenase beta subunit n=1 Tax=Thermogemmatispora argillosa TaxID=2045280 RepID=A0A455SZ37_9CHLR|nr:hypothetical biphenyl dioxygenase beta subunit [Thermogemmatispora argillosa]